MTATPPPRRSDRWAVVGGGFLGMTLALRAAQAGHEVTLIEAAPELGGQASAWRLGDVVWDRYYHVTLLSDGYTRAILKELGIEDEMQWVEAKTAFYAGGKLYPMSNVFEYLKLPVLGTIDKLRIAATIAYGSRIRNWKRLEATSAEEWLTKLSGRRAFENLWLPLLRAKLGENYRQTSAAFIWATIARLYAARRTGLKKEMLGYVRGGYARTIERFSETLRNNGVHIRLGVPVEKVCPKNGKIVLETTSESKMSPPSSDSFDSAVVTLPCSRAAVICDGLTDVERKALQNVVYMGIVCASVLVKRPLAGYYLTYITDPDPPFTAVVEMSSVVDRKHFGGATLVYLPKYVSPADPLLARRDSEIRDCFLSALEDMYPHFTRSDVMAFGVSRLGQVLSVPTLGYSDRLPPMKTSVPGLYIVNSAHIVNGTSNVNETIRLAESVAPGLLGASG